MKNSILIASLLAVFGLSACDRPTVVNVPATSVPVAGPAGPPGETGAQGMTGSQGETGSQGNTGNQGYDGAKGDPGKTGGSTLVVVPVPTEQK